MAVPLGRQARSRPLELVFPELAFATLGPINDDRSSENHPPLPHLVPMSGKVLTHELPETLPGATEFTDDPNFGDPAWILTELQRHPDILEPLIEATTCGSRFGRRRLPGKWALVQLAFTLSGQVDVEAFCNSYRSSSIWTIAGFPNGMPTPQTVWNRLTELEDCADAFVEAANKLIRRCVAHEPQIADYVWTDGTGFETHARLEHHCTDRARCKAAGGKPAKFLKRATEDLVKESRHAETAEPEPATRNPGNTLAASAAPSSPGRHRKRRRPYRYFEIGGHTYRTLDPDAGARRYDRDTAADRVWFGGIEQAAVSYFVGAPLALNLFPANNQEFTEWPELLSRIERATGRKPKAVSFDRGYSIKEVFEHNTRAGIATVAPWRKPRHDVDREQMDSEQFDRHGVPRCQHCGAPGDFESAGLGYYKAKRQPRIRFRCMLRVTPECSGTQSIACSAEWRLLVPLSRRSAVYHALSARNKNYERTFRHWRSRYLVAGNGVDARPKRPGLAWANLRASAALLLEWFRIALRHGWIGSHRHRNRQSPRRISSHNRERNLLSFRHREGLDLPYGPAAVRAGVALTTFPLGPPGVSPPP